MQPIVGPPGDRVAPAGRGRPRDPHIDERVLAATRQCLTEAGFEQTTILSVARLAKVATSTIYRRWPSRIELIEEAIFPGLDRITITPTGDLHKDLERYHQAFLDVYTQPAHRAALPGLLLEYQSRDASHFAAGRSAFDVRRHFRAAFASASPGCVDADIDADDVFDLLIGAVLFKALLAPLTPRAGRPDRTLQLLERAISPNRRSV